MFSAAYVLVVDALTFSISAALVAVGVPEHVGRPDRDRREKEHWAVGQVAVGVPSRPGGGAQVASAATKGGYWIPSLPGGTHRELYPSGLTESLRFIRANTVLMPVVLVATIGLEHSGMERWLGLFSMGSSRSGSHVVSDWCFVTTRTYGRPSHAAPG